MKRDELNDFHIKNSDGNLPTEENPLKNIKEINSVPEVLKEEDEVFITSEENKVSEENDTKSFNTAPNSESESSTGVGATGATDSVVGGVVAAVAVSAVLVLGIVKLPLIPAVDVELISASSSSLAFALTTNIEEYSDLAVILSSGSYEVRAPFQEYVKFVELDRNTVYTLSIYQGDESRYSSNFYTNDQIEHNNINIVVTSYIDDKLYFYFEDILGGDKLYTVNVKNSAGTALFKDDTNTPKSYEMNNFTEDVAIFVSVDGVITAGLQVYKPIYDYEHIEWIWSGYGDTVEAVIPSLNNTASYHVRDIRNFEIEREEATCSSSGYVIRQAAFIGPDKNRYENQREFILPALGHDFSNMTYTWSNSYHKCKAEATCSHCGVEIEETVETVIENIEGDVSYTKYTASFENENFSTRYHYEDLTYGYYPQSELTDGGVIAVLTNQYGTPLTDPNKWTSYSYYAEGSAEQYMYYTDVDFDSDGELDYRGVYFSSYRPINTLDALGNSSYQYDNGYRNNTAYWFNYEPIEWEVLDQGDNALLITSKIILDSQSFYHDTSNETFDHNYGVGYANNYDLSDIRYWLNDEFYDLAFGNDNRVMVTYVDNSLQSTLDSENNYICEDTSDNVFLLSRKEVSEYLSENTLNVGGSDYAKCQGLYVASTNDNGFWGLRTPYPNEPYQIRYITNNGSASYDSITKTSVGVRPACWIDLT